MAVTINEMNVEVQPSAQPSAQAAPATSGAGKKDIDLHQALQMLHVRQHRLQAD